MHTNRLVTLVAGVLVLTPVASAQTPAPSGAGTVTLPLTEYNRLVDLAARPPQPADGPPVAAVVSRAAMRVRVEGELARGVFTLTGDVLRAGLTRVPLIANATLVDARTNGRALPLVADGATHTALLEGPAPFAVTLDWASPIALTPGRGSFVLPVPAAGSADLVLDVPGEQAEVQVSPGLVTRRSAANARTVVEVTLDPGSAAQVSWSMRDRAPFDAAQGRPREVRTLADVMTLVTLGESDVRMVTLVDITVVSGEPGAIDVRLPAGYELASVTGTSLESSAVQSGVLSVSVSDPSARRHQFLLSLERPHPGGSFTLDTAFPAVTRAQRERGDVAVEGVGTLELTAAERDGLHRIDVRELNRALASLARYPLLAAFRYHHGGGTPPPLSLTVKRFADAAVLPAVAERAAATTLVTTEGRALTEVSLWIQNRGQRYVRVTLPPGASIVSVEVAGQAAKPVTGADGTRVPLTRTGLRPTGPYAVSFVYMHAGAPLARKGEMSMTLPALDMPIGLLEWEVFVPDRYKMRRTGGNVIAMDAGAPLVPFASTGAHAAAAQTIAVSSGQIVGRATDPTGVAVPGVTIELEVAGLVRRTAATDANGVFVIPNVPSGPIAVNAKLAGFATVRRSFIFDQRPRQVDFELRVSGVAESVTVTAEPPPVVSGSEVTLSADRGVPRAAPSEAPQAGAPSANVVNLQRRAAGVLPVRVDVPRAGTSLRFVKPLVVQEEARAAFRYSRR